MSCKVRTREVTGVFHSRKALVDAAEEAAGGRVRPQADIDVSASFDELQRRLSYGAIPAPDIADIPTAPRQPFLGEDDVEVVIAVCRLRLAGCAAAVAMAFFLVVKDFRPIPVGDFIGCDWVRIIGRCGCAFGRVGGCSASARED